MQHHRFPEMTFGALNNRADSTAIMDTVAELIGGDDLREIIVFLRHEQDELGGNSGYRPESQEVIGVALCDLDDPLAAPEVLSRDDAVELFGIQWVEDRELVK